MNYKSSTQIKMQQKVILNSTNFNLFILKIINELIIFIFNLQINSSPRAGEN